MLFRSCAFEWCDSLTNITIPENVTSFRDAPYSYSAGLKTAGPIGSGANIEFGWTTFIPSRAFHNSRDLISITIPDSVKYIGNYTFCFCTGLTSITIPDNVTTIGSGAFYGCENLNTIYLENGIETIEEQAFNNVPGPLTVYFYGTQNEWNRIDIKDNNDVFRNANVIYAKRDHI